ncbi:hypothetical protein OF83DRAFT_1059256, partial [Amylostereum chailletii]
SSGYKAWEFLLYIFGMCPVILYGILPRKYWRNFCKLVVGIRILYAHVIRWADLRMAQKLLLEFAREFELLYYQRKESRLHFCRQSIHPVAHMAPESGRVGPLGLVGQWVMERTIGDLGQEVKQPSNPYANLSQRGLQCAQVNALKSVMPDLEADEDALPRGSVDLGDKYVLLRPMDTVSHEVPYTEADFINAYWVGAGGHGAPGGITHVRKWGRVRLANRQNVRSAWKEKERPLENIRMSRIIKIRGYNGQQDIAEVQYFYRVRLSPVSPTATREELETGVLTLALVSVFERPNPMMLDELYGAAWIAAYGGRTNLRVIPVKDLIAVVAMVPQVFLPEIYERRGYIDGMKCYLLEKPGLDAIYKGRGESMDE